MPKTAKTKKQTASVEQDSAVEQIAPPMDAPEATAPTEEQIANRAYEIFLQRGGDPGNDIEDWLQAERELSGEGES